jgi:hypothetical protein
MSGYAVREVTGDSGDPSIDQVVDIVLLRARNPRNDSHVDILVEDAVERHSQEAVEECVRLILRDGLTHRRAGAAAFGPDEYLVGIDVGSAISAYLYKSQP